MLVWKSDAVNDCRDVLDLAGRLLDAVIADHALRRGRPLNHVGIALRDRVALLTDWLMPWIGPWSAQSAAADCSSAAAAASVRADRSRVSPAMLMLPCTNWSLA